MSPIIGTNVGFIIMHNMSLIANTNIKPVVIKTVSLIEGTLWH